MGKDQDTWNSSLLSQKFNYQTLSVPDKSPLKAEFNSYIKVHNWLFQPSKMAYQEDSGSPYTDVLHLKLQQIDSNANQFEIQLLTLQSLEQTQAITAKIASIQENLARLQNERENISRRERKY